MIAYPKIVCGIKTKNKPGVPKEKQEVEAIRFLIRVFTLLPITGFFERNYEEFKKMAESTYPVECFHRKISLLLFSWHWVRVDFMDLEDIQDFEQILNRISNWDFFKFD